jgi:hypothetical protein
MGSARPNGAAVNAAPVRGADLYAVLHHFLAKMAVDLGRRPERRHEQEDRGVGFGRRVQRGIEAMLIGRGNCQRLHVFHTDPSSL